MEEDGGLGRRSLHGRPHPEEQRLFERSQGFVVLAGQRLEAVGLAGRPS